MTSLMSIPMPQERTHDLQCLDHPKIWKREARWPYGRNKYKWEKKEGRKKRKIILNILL